MFLRSIVLALMLMPSPAPSQQAVPPPPKPADSGPTLEVTMQFIQDKLNEMGKVSRVRVIHNTQDDSYLKQTLAEEIADAMAEPAECHIAYHLKFWVDGEFKGESSAEFALRDVQDLVLGSEQDLARPSVLPYLVIESTTPAITVLKVRKSHSQYDLLSFSDAQLADRVAKALTHAVELCGGGNKDPF